jgi:hypothetical protein
MNFVSNVVKMLIGILIIPMSVSYAAQNTSGRDSIGMVAPVFGHIVFLHVPMEFKSADEVTKGNFYIHEFVPAGETVDSWTQMITVTGNRSPQLVGGTPKQMAEGMASGYKRTCPSSFAARAIFQGVMNGNDAFVMLVGCGSADASGSHSEVAQIAVVKADNEFVSFQWAERGVASDSPPALDAPMWSARFSKLMPLKICPVVEGEAAPYPSCVGSGK